MDMKKVKQQVIAKLWPKEKNKVGDAYRSLSKQIEGIIRSLNNAQSDAAWLPLDWMGIDKTVELVLYIYNRPRDRMLLDRLSRKRKHPDYSGFRMMDKEKLAQEDTELTYEVDDITWHNRDGSNGRLREIKRVKILDSIKLIYSIIEEHFKQYEYEEMIFNIMNVNSAIYTSLIDEYGLFCMMGLRIEYPGYIEQYVELIYRTICRLVIEFILTKKTAGKVKSRLVNYTMAISQITDRVEKYVEDYKHDSLCEDGVENIMLRFFQYLHRKDYYGQLKQIMHQLEYTPSYIGNIESCKLLTNHQKQTEIQTLLRAAAVSGNYVASDEEINENVLLFEIFADKSVYDRRTARTIVNNIWKSSDQEVVTVDHLDLRFLDMKYLRGCIYALGGEELYLTFCDLRNAIGELILLPYSVFDDRLLYEVIYKMFQGMLNELQTHLLQD